MHVPRTLERRAQGSTEAVSSKRDGAGALVPI